MKIINNDQGKSGLITKPGTQEQNSQTHNSNILKKKKKTSKSLIISKPTTTKYETSKMKSEFTSTNNAYKYSRK